ncbi:MAG: hypothetical protein GX260_00625 [Tissierellia bacterium]|jgi:DNA-binding MarR family transcriptional regulator|nr:hypothetical protein [Bacillota bacterium]NLL22272.1 hypothetical protein [Tissierellia bacterium]
MASYHREIRKWVGILLDKIFLEHAYRPKISDLSLEQAHVLLKFPDGASLTEYTRFYKVKRSEALSLLDSLIRAGYVIKREDPEDLRRRKLFLSEKGERAQEILLRDLEEKMEFLLTGLSHNEEVGILKFISRINQLTVEKFQVRKNE